MSLVIEGRTLREATVAGLPLDRARTYLLVAPEFLLAGGNGYAALTEGAPPVPLPATDSEVVIQAWRARGTVSPRVEGRVTVR